MEFVARNKMSYNYQPPEVGAISGRTFDRGLSAPDTITTMPWSDAVVVDKTKYGANHFNDTGKGVLYALSLVVGGPLIGNMLGSELLEIGGENMTNKEQQLSNLYRLTVGILKAVKQNKAGQTFTINVLVNGAEKDIVFTELDNNRVARKFGDEPEVIIEDMTFDKIIDILERDRLCKLDKCFRELLEFNTLPAVEFEVDPQTSCVIPKIEAQQCPGKYPFIQIHAGTTYHRKCQTKKEIADAATTVVRDGMFAATVVGGCSPRPLSENSQAYSALVTAAALEAVKHGVLGLGLSEDDLKNYFFDTLQQLDIPERFPGGEPNSRGVTFGGVVFYFDKAGNPKIFVYGLGNTAVAARTKVESKTTTETYHLQGEFASMGSTMEVRLPALGPNYRRVQAKHVTALDFAVEVTAGKSIQLMTDGCALAFFDLDTETKIKTEETDDGLLTLECKQLPEHGAFKPQTFFDLANREVNIQNLRQLSFLCLESGHDALCDKIVDFSNAIEKSDDSHVYWDIANQTCREMYDMYKEFDKNNPADKINKANYIKTLDKVEKLVKMHVQTLGDDTLHLSIDLEAACAYLKPATSQMI